MAIGYPQILWIKHGGRCVVRRADRVLRYRPKNEQFGCRPIRKLTLCERRVSDGRQAERVSAGFIRHNDNFLMSV